MARNWRGSLLVWHITRTHTHVHTHKQAHEHTDTYRHAHFALFFCRTLKGPPAARHRRQTRDRHSGDSFLLCFYFIPQPLTLLKMAAHQVSRKACGKPHTFTNEVSFPWKHDSLVQWDGWNVSSGTMIAWEEETATFVFKNRPGTKNVEFSLPSQSVDDAVHANVGQFG